MKTEQAFCDKICGCLLGLACGDALGASVEFSRPGTFAPITGMKGGGPYHLRSGEWTDDTSMALCLAESLVTKQRFDAKDQMERYVRWFREGYWSSNGKCFDIGDTVSYSIRRFENTQDPYTNRVHDMSAGNGCIMRLAPVPLYFRSDWNQAIELAGKSSKTTHGANECIECCRLLAAIIVRALTATNKDEVILHHGLNDFSSPRLRAIANGEYRKKIPPEIQGTGYVVSCLEAALWSFMRSNTFAEAVLTAVNLGNDADTTGAVCGQIAGAFYGLSSIPHEWLNVLARKEEILDLAEKLSDCA
jgi:ADP-ribosyl-[dinitrogen reductase] hydrolase